MKKLLIVLSVLSISLFISCSNKVEECIDNSTVISSEKGTIVLSIAKSFENPSARLISADTEMIYVRAWNDSVSVPVSQDVTKLNTAKIEVTLPVGSYTLEAIAAKKDNYQMVAQTYAFLENIEVSANEYTNANMTLTKPTVSFEFKDKDDNVVTDLIGSSKYTVTVKSDTIPKYKYSLSCGYVTINFYDGTTKLGTEIRTGNDAQAFTTPNVSEEKILKLKSYGFDNNFSSDYIYFYFDDDIKMAPASGGIILGLN